MSIDIWASAGAWILDKYGKEISDKALEGIKQNGSTLSGKMPQTLTRKE